MSDHREDPPLTYNKNKEYKNYNAQDAVKHNNHPRGQPYNKKYGHHQKMDERPRVTNITPNNFYDLRERLTYELNNESCDCLICCSKIRRNSRIWSCFVCFNVYHVACIKEWAISSMKDSTWTCPSCKTAHTAIPNNYKCFCGKTKDPPKNDYSITAHSCGNVCGKIRPCSHKCVSFCHPGKCPCCIINMKVQCYCGNTCKTERCQGFLPGFSCQTRECGRLMACRVHFCRSICHPDTCGNCEEEIDLNCFCAKKTCRVKCCDKTEGFRCGGVCQRKLSCSVHDCGELCHSGNCPTCLLHIENLKTCACGKTGIGEIFRENYGILHAIPTCNKICGKKLKCAVLDSQNGSHSCPLKCHVGECPSFCRENSSLVYCECKKTRHTVTCREAYNLTKKCEMLCNARKVCKRHTCHQKCCSLILHYCSRTCGRSLSCKNHICEETCHAGKCGPCDRLNYDELSCHCGGTTLHPPTPCGTQPPVCPLPCTRPQVCLDHPVNHDCHLTGSCPPCNVRITANCYGGHKKLDSILCYLKSFSCGDRCGKQIGCGVHRCTLTCHQGPCAPNGCRQPCATMRTDCPHPCSAPCGDHAECCTEPCRRIVEAYCSCGRRSERVSCGVTISQIDCDDSCVKQRRTEGLIKAFGVPDFTSAYSLNETFLQTARQNMNFIKYVEKTLLELIRALDEGAEDSAVYNFPVMAYDRCVLIEKMAEYYGCVSTVYDSEPHMNTTVIAYKGRSAVPASLVSYLCRNCPNSQ